MVRVSIFVACFILTASSALAEGFQRVGDRNGFVSIVADRDLKRFGVRLQVTEDGRILGSAFGQKVTGEWQWDGSYFCRDILISGDSIGKNCQTVEISGNTVRFTADRGAGDFADLRLE